MSDAEAVFISACFAVGVTLIIWRLSGKASGGNR